MGLNSSMALPELNITSVSVSRSTGLQLIADAEVGARVALWMPMCALSHLQMQSPPVYMVMSLGT